MKIATLAKKIKYREEREKSDRYEEFKSSRGLWKTKGSPHPLRLIDKRNDGDSPIGSDALPLSYSWADHVNLWVRGGDSKAVMFTSEPYNISAGERHSIEHLAGELGINYRIIAPNQSTSMCVPGQTWFVGLVRKGYETLLPEERPRRREAILATKEKRNG